MSHIKCIRCQLSNLWCKAVCNFKACLLGSGGEQMESMFCMLHCCSSREPSPLHAVSTWEQPLVLLCSCQKLLSGASSRANTRAPGPGRAIRPGALLSTAGHLMCHNAFSWLALKDGCHRYCVSGSLGEEWSLWNFGIWLSRFLWMWKLATSCVILRG